MSQQQFSEYTQRLRERMPSWSKIRHDPQSIGAQFLSVVGFQLDEIAWMLEYAHNQYYLTSADIEQADVIYKAPIPSHLKYDMAFRFEGGSHILEQEPTVEKFLLSKMDLSQHPELTYRNACFVDFGAKFVYVLRPYDRSEEHPDGYVKLSILDNVKKEISEQMNLELQLHMVWNFFDEFGLLLNLPRLYGERNAEYKERLLDVFRRPAGSDKQGMINAIVRELGMVRKATWNDGGSSLTLRTARVDKESIMVDGEPFPQEMIGYDNNNRIVLHGHPNYAGMERQVSFNASVTLHELHDQKDQAFQEGLFNPDGSASENLHEYIRIIRDQIPSNWGQWRWSQGAWDTSKEEVGGQGKIPSFYDSGISAWKNYKPKGV